jgi:hypothetical protein
MDLVETASREAKVSEQRVKLSNQLVEKAIEALGSIDGVKLLNSPPKEEGVLAQVDATIGPADPVKPVIDEEPKDPVYFDSRQPWVRLSKKGLAVSPGNTHFSINEDFQGTKALAASEDALAIREEKQAQAVNVAHKIVKNLQEKYSEANETLALALRDSLRDESLAPAAQAIAEGQAPGEVLKAAQDGVNAKEGDAHTAAGTKILELMAGDKESLFQASQQQNLHPVALKVQQLKHVHDAIDSFLNDDSFIHIQ